MHKSLNCTQWTFRVILIIIVLGATGAFAANPVPLSASYDDATNILEIIFDQPIHNDSSKVNRSMIVLDGDEGGANPDLQLSGGIIQVDAEGVLSESIQILVTLDDQRVIENMVDRTSLKLLMGARTFLNESLEGNSEITLANAVTVSYIVDPNPPVPVSAVYDANLNTFTLQFNKKVVTRTLNFIGIGFDDDMGGENADIQFSSDHVELSSVGETETLEFTFSPKYQQRIELADTDNLKLTLREYAVRDQARNTNKVITVADDISVTYLPQNSAEDTDVLSASYDAGTNKLTIEFNEPIITTYKWHTTAGDPVTLDAVKYTGIKIYDAGIDSGATLSGQASVTVYSKKTLIIGVLPADQRLIETLKNRDQLKLLIDEYGILDASGNGSRAFTLADDISIDFTDVSPEQTPTILDASYDAAKNILDLNFGNVTSRTRNVDTSDVLLTGIGFDVGGDTLRLSGGTINGEKTGRPPYIRHIWIDVLPEDEAKLETIKDKSSIKLLVDPITFMFETSKNGNLAITADSNKVVAYVADEAPAAVTRAKYDERMGQCFLTLDKLVQIDEFDPTGITLGGATLTGGTVVESGYASEVTINVTDADKQTLEALDVAIKTDLTAQIDAGALVNLDGAMNSVLSFVNGDTTAAGDTITVGYGRGFWDQSFEAFPTLAQLVPASLRGLGDHCYVYVSDDDWGTVVTQDVVDSIIYQFEVSCPASAEKGIYQLCREVYGDEPDTDNDPRIALVLLNLRDEYDEGRSGKYSTFPKAGYFTTNNELPDSVYAHSNEIDMIYLDTTPIIEIGAAGNALAQYFSHMIMSNVDPDEFGTDENNPGRWLPEGLGAMAQVICGYDFTSYKTEGGVPIYVPDPAANNVLTYWTGWQAGETSDLADLYNSFLFSLYLYENYGGTDIIHRIATDTANGLTSIDTSLARWARANGEPKVTVDEVFDDYAIASFVDKIGDPVAGDKYGFKAVDIGTPFMKAIAWDRISEWDTESNWSFKFYKIKQEDIPEAILFNGVNGSEINAIAFSVGTDTLLRVSASLDANNEGVINKMYDGTNSFNSEIMLMVTTKNRSNNNASNYVISKDNQPSEFVDLGVFQNASADRMLDIYVSSREQLYTDVPTSAAGLVDNAEGPLVNIVLNNEVTATVQAARRTTNSSSSFLYHTEFMLSQGGNYTLEAVGQDMAGNDFTSANASLNMTARKMLAAKGGSISAEDGKSTLKVLPGSISNDMFFTSIVFDEQSISKVSENYVSATYRFGPQTGLKQAALLEFKYDSDVDGSGLAVYRKEGEIWTHVGGTVDVDRKTISVSVAKLGDFRVAAGQPDQIVETEELPTTFTLSQNYPNPFNPATTIQYGIPKNADVRITIYNILGEQVDQIVHKNLKAGYHKFHWDATTVGSGVYFYKLTAGDFTQIKKMSVLK